MNRKLLAAATALMVFGPAMSACAGERPAGSPKPEKTVLEHYSKAPFAAVPSLPECTRMTGMRGNPAEEPSTLMVQMDGGCAATTHWHTANEEMLLLQGAIKAQIVGQPEVDVRAGAYILLPARSHHRFRCVSEEACILFLVADRPFDVHNVGEHGKEISAEEAIRAAGRAR